VTSNVTLKVATAGVDRYAQQISTQLLPGARLARLADGTGTVECHTPDGQQRTGQQYFALRNSVEDLTPARYPEMVDQLRRTWVGLGHRILEDTHGKEGDPIFAVATPTTTVSLSGSTATTATHRSY
jgi:hypothetical protein